MPIPLPKGPLEKYYRAGKAVEAIPITWDSCSGLQAAAATCCKAAAMEGFPLGSYHFKVSDTFNLCATGA